MNEEQAPISSLRRNIRRDYQKKDFQNPYFHQPKKIRRFKVGRYLKIISAIILIYVIVYSALFRIGGVGLAGNDLISRDEFLNVVNQNLKIKRFFILPQSNMIFFSKGRLARDLNAKYSLNKLTIRRGWRSLNITIEEKTSHLIIYNNKTQLFYFSDLAGAVTKELARDEAMSYASRFPILNINQDALNIGDQIAYNEFISFVLALDKSAKEAKINVQGYEKRGVDELALVAKDGWRAYFSIKNELKPALDNLILILKEKSAILKKIQYIDLTLGDKVFIGQ